MMKACFCGTIRIILTKTMNAKTSTAIRMIVDGIEGHLG